MGKNRPKQESYEGFKQYLYIMHYQAIDTMNSLEEKDRNLAENFFQNYYPTKKEHYWTLMKLFTLAMYIPMFLQIGMSAKSRGWFDALIYVDTHAGPGIARVGGDKEDLVLGSPMIAIKWPEIIASNVPSYKKIKCGFDELYFIEKDPETYRVLHRIIANTGIEKAKTIRGDVNHKLKSIKNSIAENYENPLILMFVDPYGEFSNQVRHSVFTDFISGQSVDLVYNVMSPSIARGLLGGKNNPNGVRKKISEYWGDICTRGEKLLLKICDCYDDPLSCSISPEDVVKIYESVLRSNRYTTVEKIKIEYNNTILYHLLVASKAPRSYKWIGGYKKYLQEKAPKDYDTLKKLWLQATGRQKSLSDFA